MTQVRRPHVDPDLAEPVRRSVDRLILRATVAYVISAAAVLVTFLSVGGPLHVLAHLALPGMLALVVASALLRRFAARQPADGDPWPRARELAGRDALLARVLTAAVPAAWLAGAAAVFLRHAPMHHAFGEVLTIWLPVGATLLATATIAWLEDVRAALAGSIVDSDERFRDYWRGIGDRA